jgi:hypothetical protein
MSFNQDADNEWQRVWFAIKRHGWTSLALVPSHSGVDVLRIAETLGATARRQGERPVHVVNGTGIHLENVQKVIDAVGSGTARGDWVIVPVDAVTDNPSAIALVQASSSALLVIQLGESLLADSESTLDAIGRERFIGSVVLDGSDVSFR